MRTEGEFNSYLGKRIKALSPAVHYIKAADKFTVGISDFLIFCKGQSMAMESKFVHSIPNPNANLLTHPFSGPQLTFLESMDLTDNHAYGLIGIYEVKKMYLIERDLLKCNWKTKEFSDNIKLYKEYDFKEVELMLFNVFASSKDFV